MDHDTKLQKFFRKCQKLMALMKFMANLVLIFLYLQNVYFTTVSNSFLTAQVGALAGGCLIVIFIVMLYLEGNSREETTRLLTRSIFKDKSMLIMALPPILYVASWQCFHLSQQIYPITTSMAKSCRILSLALFSILILGRSFFMTQILGMCFVAFGMLKLTQMQMSLTEIDDLSKNPVQCCYIVFGLVFYGLSFALVEKQFKRADTSFWITAIQYCLYYVPGFLIVSYSNDQHEQGFWAASDIFTWFYIVFYTAQMIIEFFVIKISDSIFMSVSYSNAIALMMLFGQSLQLSGLGGGFIFYGTVLYVALEFSQVFPLRRENNADFRIINRFYPDKDCKEVLTFLPSKDARDHIETN